jgi:hypothetical protein
LQFGVAFPCNGAVSAFKGAESPCIVGVWFGRLERR